jgi:preprotein translocase subunit SecE
MATKFKNPITAVIQFIKESRDELKKVSWPSRPVTVRYTAIVIVSSIGIGLVMGAVDYAFTFIIKRFIL